MLGEKQIINKDVYSLALDRVRRAYELLDHIVVMFSGGKDSTAVLNIVLEVAQERGIDRVPCYFYDEEAIPYDTENYVRRVSKNPMVDLKWLCLPVVHLNACSTASPVWYPWGVEDEDKWVRPLPPEAITKIPDYDSDVISERLPIPEMHGILFPPSTWGSVGIVMGIRADESLMRQRVMLNSLNRENAFIIDAEINQYKVYPIYDWTTEDVWTAPKRFDWDYNVAYDVMDRAGIKPSQQRCAPPYGAEPMRGLWQYKQCWPDIWDKMQSRVPGAGTAAMYGRTKLYAYGEVPEKPQGVTWEEFAVSILSKWGPSERTEVAELMRSWIKRHHNKTRDPILSVPHPVSGLSWKFLVMLAFRGDFKKRKAVMGPVDPNSREFFLCSERYYAEKSRIAASK